MHDQKKFDISKENDEKLKKAIEARNKGYKLTLLNGTQDKKKKRDMSLKVPGRKRPIYIDTKYTDQGEKGQSFQTEDMLGQKSQTDWILFCLRKSGFKKCWWVKTKALMAMAEDGRKLKKGHDGSKYFRFSFDEISDKDKHCVDYSDAGLK